MKILFCQKTQHDLPICYDYVGTETILIPRVQSCFEPTRLEEFGFESTQTIGKQCFILYILPNKFIRMI